MLTDATGGVYQPTICLGSTVDSKGEFLYSVFTPLLLQCFLRLTNPAHLLKKKIASSLHHSKAFFRHIISTAHCISNSQTHRVGVYDWRDTVVVEVTFAPIIPSTQMIPSSSTLWANMGPWIQSPIAGGGRERERERWLIMLVIPEFVKIAKCLYTHLHRKKWYSKVMY